MNESLKSLLFDNNLEIVTKDTEKEKTTERLKNVKIDYNYICNQCSFKCNSYIREIEHSMRTKHRMRDVSGLWNF